MKRLDQHWWYIERPFPWPLIVGGVVALALVAALLVWASY